MKIIASLAISIDGFINDKSPNRLTLSSPEDIKEVYSLRAKCDGILVGASTIRNDNPALVTRTQELIKYRARKNMKPDPVKITITESGNLSPTTNFFVLGKTDKIVYCPEAVYPNLKAKLKGLATVIYLNKSQLNAKGIIADLEKRKIKTLMIEGGAKTLSMFFREDLVNEFRLAITPLFLGARGRTKFTDSSFTPYNERLRIKSIKKLGDTVVIYYKIK